MFTEKEVLRFVEENNVKFVRLTFCDVLGVVKNISVLASALPAALKNGVAVDGKSIDGFSGMNEESLLLIPDPNTLSLLPWRPRTGAVIRLFCDIQKPDGSRFDGDCRYVLENAVRELKSLGVGCEIGTDCQFYLFETDDRGRATKTPVDDAGYLDVAPLDKGEDIRRDICLTLDSLGMEPRASHHEKGPGQNEIDFKHSEPLSAADNLLVFKTLVKAISARNGAYATFIPEPILAAPQSWLNINFNLSCKDIDKERFFAGVSNRLRALASFVSPSADIYAVGKSRAKWIGGNGEFKLLGMDPTCNPYLALSLVINAGIAGIKGDEKGTERIAGKEFVNAALPKDLIKAYNVAVSEMRKLYEESDDKEAFVMARYFRKA